MVASSIGSEELAGLHPSASSHLLGEVLVYIFYSIFDLCCIGFSPYVLGKRIIKIAFTNILVKNQSLKTISRGR